MEKRKRRELILRFEEKWKFLPNVLRLILPFCVFRLFLFLEVHDCLVYGYITEH